jgi:hypothetical protein
MIPYHTTEWAGERARTTRTPLPVATEKGRRLTCSCENVFRLSTVPRRWEREHHQPVEV